jgi:hypothetical protein
MRIAYTILIDKPEGNMSFGNTAVDKRIILKCFSRKYGWRLLSGFIWLRIGTYGGLL